VVTEVSGQHIHPAVQEELFLYCLNLEHRTGVVAKHR